MDDDDLARETRRRCGVGFAPWIVLLAAVALAAALAVLLFTATVHAAPAPAYREPPPLERRIEGHWYVTWTGSAGTCYLSRRGFWACTIGDATWHGSWSLDGRTLTIRERRVDSPTLDETAWTITLDDSLRAGAEGVLAGGGAFALRPGPAPGQAGRR